MKKNEILRSINAHLKRNNNNLVKINNQYKIKCHDEESCNLLIESIKEEITQKKASKISTLDQVQTETTNIGSLDDLESTVAVSIKFSELYNGEWVKTYLMILKDKKISSHGLPQYY